MGSPWWPYFKVVIIKNVVTIQTYIFQSSCMDSFQLKFFIVSTIYSPKAGAMVARF